MSHPSLRYRLLSWARTVARTATQGGRHARWASLSTFAHEAASHRARTAAPRPRHS